MHKLILTVAIIFSLLATVVIHQTAQAKKPELIPWYITKQIRVATIIGHAARHDPWPNCADPIWNGAANWSITVACENRYYHEVYGYPREWTDSPGKYRCGLQFDPMWERIYGQLCPY